MRFVLAFIGMMLLAFGTASAEGGKLVVVDTIRVTGYRLGQPLVPYEFRGRIGSTEVSAKVQVVGLADATPFRICGTDKECSKRENIKIARMREDGAKSILKDMGFSIAEEFPNEPIVSDIRGDQYRGVMIYILREEKPAIAPVVPAVSNVSPGNAFADSIARMNETVRVLRDSLKKMPEMVAVKADSAVTRVVEKFVKGYSEELKKDRPSQGGILFDNVNFGVGVVGMKANNGADSFAPSLGVFIKPRSVRFELALEAGYRPAKSSNVCNRADVFGAISVRVPVSSHIAISGGVFTDRESCTDGGPKLAERSLSTTNGVSFGFVSGVDIGHSFRLNLKPEVAYGQTTTAQTLKKQSGAAFRLGAEIRTQSGRK